MRWGGVGDEAYAGCDAVAMTLGLVWMSWMVGPSPRKLTSKGVFRFVCVCVPTACAPTTSSTSSTSTTRAGGLASSAMRCPLLLPPPPSLPPRPLLTSLPSLSLPPSFARSAVLSLPPALASPQQPTDVRSFLPLPSLPPAPPLRRSGGFPRVTASRSLRAHSRVAPPRSASYHAAVQCP
eukprot:3574906-Rhodomonas_salina.2